MASTLLKRLAALSGQDEPPPMDRDAEIAAIRGIFDAYFARLDAAVQGEVCDAAYRDLHAAVAVFVEEAQATLRAIERDPDYRAWVAARRGGGVS